MSLLLLFIECRLKSLRSIHSFCSDHNTITYSTWYFLLYLVDTTSTGTYDSRITIIICWYGTVPYQPQLLVVLDNTDGGMVPADTCCYYDGTGTL